MPNFNLAKIILSLIFLLAVSFLNTAPVYALSITVHVPEKYTDVVAGERFYFEVEIKYPENPKRKDLRLEYKITRPSKEQGGDGKIIAQAKFLKAIETQASFMDFIVIPEVAQKGLHLIEIEIKDYGELEEKVSATFYVTAGLWSQLRMYFFILLVVIILVGVLVAIQIVILNKKRKK